MKRYTLATLSRLKPGDTFYKDGDQTEVMYTVLPNKCAYGGMRYVRKGELRMTDMLKKRQGVIFLKHKQPEQGVK